MNKELNYPEVRKITIKELSERLKTLSYSLDDDNSQAVQCAIYLINKLNGFIYYDLRTKNDIIELIDNI